ncbi:hypothetical protein QBC46DRAFT_117449 [Diplogelasinospora grovesii]|uniref:Uncharacterized protein n=1 Tax=Diplogelasinospora grovesii TaxID=303347 RepID=A0AAN6NHX8_9PEZI|nr:hypothetical protein QBC46DRAFT_117449 [Diplogelasinospora grovesii]
MVSTTRISAVGQLPIMLIPEEDEAETLYGADAGPEYDMSGKDDDDDAEDDELPPAPRHPIPSMQAAFAESLVEATKGGSSKPKLRTGDAKTRREELLDGEKDDGPPAAGWRFRPGQRCHELRRLMAQISFGVYLLLNGMANSQMSVFSILQGHIDEVDEFLETTLEDIALATKDLNERIDLLKLPMDNMEVFEQMLEDRNFRLQIVEGNVKIEHIVSRTQTALLQSVEDITEGIQVTRDFMIYLAEQQHGRWRQERPDVIDIFDAMKGNTDGWFNAFIELQAKGNALNAVIVKINAMVSEIERRTGEVSRKTRFSIQPFTSPGHTPRGSDASSISTATPASPTMFIPSEPPRLSLRLSTIIKSDLSDSESYFDIPMARQSFAESIRPSRRESVKEPPREPAGESLKEPVRETVRESVRAPTRAPVRDSFAESVRDSVVESGGDLIKESVMELAILQPTVYTPKMREGPTRTPTVSLPLSRSPLQSPEQSPPQSPQSPPPPARNPRRISDRPVPQVETPVEEDEEEEEEEEESPVFILQPRTYTPLPPAPVPSPRLKEERPREERPREERPRNERPANERPRNEQPRMEQPRTRAEPQRPRVNSPNVAAELPFRRADPPRPNTRSSASPSLSSERVVSTPSMASRSRVETPQLRSQPSKPKLVAIPPRAESWKPQSRRSPEVEQVPMTIAEAEPEQEDQPRHRTSLRERVSLRTTPPQSIHVPPPNALGLQHPVYPPPRTLSSRVYQAPDSAYGSDPDRTHVNSMASMEPSINDFSPPVIRPGLIPSPHSDKQFFRPVDASPHSPLQQRPHTSHLQAPPRNIPSAMGMSMMSNVTTMTNETGNETGSQRSLKKKRSAFGWLKKAFSLDEEERAAFEAKKREQTRNLYYDHRSPQFLDGTRIQSRQTYQ